MRRCSPDDWRRQYVFCPECTKPAQQESRQQTAMPYTEVTCCRKAALLRNILWLRRHFKDSGVAIQAPCLARRATRRLGRRRVISSLRPCLVYRCTWYAVMEQIKCGIQDASRPARKLWQSSALTVRRSTLWSKLASSMCSIVTERCTQCRSLCMQIQERCLCAVHPVADSSTGPRIGC